MKTFSPKPHDIERRWYVIDATGAVLGRLASEVAKILRGKHTPIFAPHADTGDHVIVVNARGVRLTGNKEQKKVFYHHSGYPGGLRRLGYARLMAERPSFAVEKAVRGMLPKNRLGRQMIKKLAVYEGANHPHKAQRPEALELGRVPKWEGLPKPKPAGGAPAAPEDGRRARRASTRKAAGGAAARTARPGASGRTPRAGATAKAKAAAPRRSAPTGRRGTATSRSRGAGAKAGQRAKKATKADGAASGEKKAARPRRKTTKES